MNEAKFTKGPWRATYSHDPKYGDGEVLDSSGRTVVIVTGTNYDVSFGGFSGDWLSPRAEEEDAIIHEANARLLGAAPELLESLVSAVDILESILDDPAVTNVNKCHVDQSDIDDMKFVINKALVGAKARGEG